jgi:hypothetical protein
LTGAFSLGCSIFAQSIKGTVTRGLSLAKNGMVEKSPGEELLKFFKILLFALNFNIKNCKQAASRKLDRNCRVSPMAMEMRLKVSGQPLGTAKRESQWNMPKGY